MNFSLSINYVIIIVILCLLVFKYYKIKKDNIIVDELIKRSQEDMMSLEGLKKLNYPKKLEITDIPKSYPQLFIRYGNNNNHLFNDGRTIWQNMVRHIDNRIQICGYRYGLSRIEWHKSILTWKNQKVGLELHIVNSLVERNKTVTFIVPLSLVDIRREGFADLGYNNQKTDVSTLNSLITKTEQIPSYTCCTPNSGPMVNFNLSNIANFILKQKFFYKYDMSPSNTWYITEPEPFDRYIGLNIINKLVG